MFKMLSEGKAASWQGSLPKTTNWKSLAQAYFRVATYLLVKEGYKSQEMVGLKRVEVRPDFFWLT